MNKFLWILVVGVFSSAVMAQDEAVLPGKNNDLYSKATNCRTLDLKTWKHPTRNVLKKFRFKIMKVQLCNNDKYPIFIGRSKYALETQPNQKYASDFYHALLKENGNWPYALVDIDSQYISYVSPDNIYGEFY